MTMLSTLRISRNLMEEIKTSSKLVFWRHTLWSFDPDSGEFVFDVMPERQSDEKDEMSGPDVCLCKGKANRYQQNLYFIENIQTEEPEAVFIDPYGIKKDVQVIVTDNDGNDLNTYVSVSKLNSDFKTLDGTVFLYRPDVELFLDSSYSVIDGNTYIFDGKTTLISSLYNKDSWAIITEEPICRCNVKLYKQKALEYRANTYVVENLQLGPVQVFKIDSQGLKVEMDVSMLEDLDLYKYHGFFD